MPVKKKKANMKPEQDAGKSISTQLSELRKANRSLFKLFQSQQSQLNETHVNMGIMWDRIGL